MGNVRTFACAAVIFAALIVLCRTEMALADTTTNEGSSGSYTLQVSLGITYPDFIAIPYWTEDGTATVADNDYVPFIQGNQSVVCPIGGCPPSWVYVTINGDSTPEPDEYFTIVFDNGQGISGQVIVTLQNDDGAVPATWTPSNTPTNTPTETPTNTPTDTPTNTPTETPTETSTGIPSDTPTETPTNTPTDTPPPTATATADETGGENETPAATATEAVSELPDTGAQPGSPASTNLLAAAVIALALVSAGLFLRRRTRST